MPGGSPSPIGRAARLNARALAVDRAGAEIIDYLGRFQEERQLTSLEMMLILTEAETRLIRTLLA